MHSLMVTMMKSSDSELAVLDFSRANNFRRACVVQKLGIWERDCPLLFSPQTLFPLLEGLVLRLEKLRVKLFNSPNRHTQLWSRNFAGIW